MIYLIAFIIVLSIVVWCIMIRYARKTYERIRDNANIETEQELITYCNLALDKINRQNMFFRWLFK